MTTSCFGSFGSSADGTSEPPSLGTRIRTAVPYPLQVLQRILKTSSKDVLELRPFLFLKSQNPKTTSIFANYEDFLFWLFWLFCGRYQWSPFSRNKDQDSSSIPPAGTRKDLKDIFKGRLRTSSVLVPKEPKLEGLPNFCQLCRLPVLALLALLRTVLMIPLL